jgi:hypothetical protein
LARPWADVRNRPADCIAVCRHVRREGRGAGLRGAMALHSPGNPGDNLLRCKRLLLVHQGCAFASSQQLVRLPPARTHRLPTTHTELARNACISPGSTKLHHRIWSHWSQARRTRGVHCSRRALVGLHPSTDYRIRDNPGDGLDQRACDGLTLSPYRSLTSQSATRRE